MGWLADRWPKKRVMLLVYVIVAAAIPFMAFEPTPALLKVFAFLFGIGLAEGRFGGGTAAVNPLRARQVITFTVIVVVACSSSLHGSGELSG